MEYVVAESKMAMEGRPLDDERQGLVWGWCHVTKGFMSYLKSPSWFA